MFPLNTVEIKILEITARNSIPFLFPLYQLLQTSSAVKFYLLKTCNQASV